MIYHLQGHLADILVDSVVIDVRGVGYQVMIPGSYQSTLPAIGEPLKLFTYHHIREDQELLFGFLSEQEKQFFLRLTSVSGVGPKVGVKILAEMTVQDFTAAILNNDVSTLVSLPGVGKKMAERMIVELKDKLDMVTASMPSFSVTKSVDQGYLDDLSLALKTLGYSKDEIKRAISKSGDLISSSDPIQASIKHILKHI